MVFLHGSLNMSNTFNDIHLDYRFTKVFGPNIDELGCDGIFQITFDGDNEKILALEWETILNEYVFWLLERVPIKYW